MANHHQIRALPPDVQAQIKPSVTITDPVGVVLELIKNALDARATDIRVAIEVRKGACVVEDNGEGIPRKEFAQDGGLGRMHCKCSGISASRLY